MHGPGAQLRWRTAATSEPASPRTSCVQTSELCRSYRARVRLRTPGPRFVVPDRAPAPHSM